MILIEQNFATDARSPGRLKIQRNSLVRDVLANSATISLVLPRAGRCARNWPDFRIPTGSEQRAECIQTAAAYNLQPADRKTRLTRDSYLETFGHFQES